MSSTPRECGGSAEPQIVLDFESASAVLADLERLADANLSEVDAVRNQNHATDLHSCTAFLDHFEQFLRETAPGE
jgi:hypothetical protein